MRFRGNALFTLLLGFCLVAPALAGEEKDTWKKPLAEKARILDANIRDRHSIFGLYPSMVQLPPKGQSIDITTATPFSDVAHAVVWTAYHLAGMSYRYAYLKKIDAPADEIADAKARADELFEAVYRCQRVTGERGMQARGYFLGHGDVYEERFGSRKSDKWHQGQADGKEFRWRGDPSHHNYSSAVGGLAQYYDLAAEGEQKDRCRQAIDALVSYWVDNDLRIYDYQKTPSDTAGESILGFTDGKTLNTRVFMAIAGARVAHHATGDAKFKRVFDQLVQQYGVRGLKSFSAEKDFDDAQHLFCHLENLFRIEDDPELLAAYRVVMDALWANHKDDAHSLFTYSYYALTPEAPDREKALKEALFSLQSWPTDMTLRPTMNSIHPERKPPYPMYWAAWDNEYIWKGGLLTADGWQSRIVTDVAVSAQDPMVIYAVDERGDLYQSRDGAATADNWRPVDQDLRSPARAVDCGPKSRIVAAACDDGFYLSTTAGYAWMRLPVPADDGAPADIQFDPFHGNVLYAVTTRGVYRSADFGEGFIGKTWESLAQGLPEAPAFAFAVAPGKPGRLYAVCGQTVFTKKLDDPHWTRGGDIGFGRYSELHPWIAVDPANPDHALAGAKTRAGGREMKTIFQETRDGGLTWSNDMHSIYEKIEEGGMREFFAALLPGDIARPAISPANDKQIFTGAGLGVRKSEDGAVSWQEKTSGLDIPVVKTALAPRHSSWVFAGTPAGLYLSKDAGETWESAHLVLQFEKNTQREIGGGSYLDAYWRGLYYGLIDPQSVTLPFEGK
ncbi:MAG TPA: hypothetical protein PLO62_14860 [Candidatus Hydrogenedentes bacterium]|nr:hypothetical protein [Candidatus Hydrogenedentota bacterium]